MKKNYRNFINIIIFISLSSISSCLCSGDDYAKKYFARPKAPSYSEDDIKNLEYLGSKIIDKGVSFNLYSKNATRVELLLFEDPESSSPVQIYEMSRYYNTWSVYIEGIGDGQFYAFRAWGPNWVYNEDWYPGSTAGFMSDVDNLGNRFNPNKVLIDPYARAYHRDHDWSKGSAGTGPYRAESTVAACAKSIVVKEGKYKWSSAEQDYWTKRKAGTLAGHGREDYIAYEVNLKGFTANLAGEIYNPGTYSGFEGMVDYLVELGVTAVEFLPIHEAGADGGYWKYWTIGFFAPEVAYASNPVRGSQVEEFKRLVDALHSKGIEVILDVVYNHTGEGGLWREKIPNGNYPADDATNTFWNYDPEETATNLVFRGIDNISYYGLSDDKRFYYEHTGCGNMIRSNNTPGNRLILDSLRYWVEEMHIDGFRFDLGSALGYEDENYSSWLEYHNGETVIDEIMRDETFRTHKTRLIAEPWDLGGYHVGDFPYDSVNSFGWYEWNGGFRDWVRGFINTDDWKLNTQEWIKPDGGACLTGTASWFNDSSTGGSTGDYDDQRKPYHSVNFITAHDGFTMYDLLSYTEKRNGIGPLNPEGVDPDSGDNHNSSRNWTDDDSTEQLKRQMYRNLVVLLFLSHGSPMMLGGDEWMRTQYGNNNPYHEGADNIYNWFRWNYWKYSGATTLRIARYRMFDFYKQIIAYRKAHKYAFAPTDFDGTGKTWLFSWKQSDNTDAVPGTWDGETIGIHYYNTSPNKQIYIAINMEEADIVFTLPLGVNWKLKIDTQLYYDLNATDDNASKTSGNFFDNTSVYTGYTVKARSITVFEEE